MEVLNQRVEKRRENFFFYNESLKDIDGITFLEESNDKFYSNHWLTTILIDPQKTKGITREDIQVEFEKNNIECRPLWKPMHLQPVFKDCPAYINGTSEHLFNNGLCLPSSSLITDEEREFVVEKLTEVLNHK